MAQHAWLDSLSEDWVSQPPSDTSQPQLPPQLPTLSSPPASSNSNKTRDRFSRIPRFHAATQRPQPDNSSPSVLSERNQNEINIRAAQFGSKPPYRGRQLSQSASASTSSSVIHNSVLQSKSHSASPPKSQENVPEWKRRLIYGELEYGESKDLFSSAATGLANMFRRPEAFSADPIGHEGHTINETTLPSSPPPYSRNRHSNAGGNDDVSEHDPYDASTQHDVTLPHPISFRLTKYETAERSSNNDAPIRRKIRDESDVQLSGVAGSSATSFRREKFLDHSRKTSDLRNEDFSPILIARRKLEGGGVSFSPIDLSAHQLRKKLENLRQDQMILDSELDSESYKGMARRNGVADVEDTAEYARNGGFLNLQRGERSIEGSFHRRPLSPPLNVDSSEMLPESSLQASTPKQFPTISTSRFASVGDKQAPVSPPSPPLPRAPHPSPQKRLHPTSIKATSPLKLFGPYDTFTNQTLLRRISQFEDQQSNSLSYCADEATSPVPVAHTESELDDKADIFPSQGHRRPPQVNINHPENPTDLNRFGAGELDDYEFEGDVSMASSVDFPFEEKENVTPLRMPSVNHLHFDIHEDISSDGESLLRRRHRIKAFRSMSSTRHLRVSKSLEGLHSRNSTGLSRPNSMFPSISNRNDSDGKRPRTSPSKDPTPKRRRTLHRSDVAFGLEERLIALETVQSSHYNMQSAVINDHHHERQVESNYLVSTNIISGQQILRPRSPTLNPRLLESRDRPPLAELGFSSDQHRPKTLISGDTTDFGAASSRKVSMKTQDFYDAAEEVMAMIRNKARPKNGLESVEESESESSDHPNHNESVMTENSFDESTREPFSRPPSRDGQPISRLPVRQEDPELVDQLKKYEESGELVDMLSQSIRSMETVQTNDLQSHDLSSTSQHVHSSDQVGAVYHQGGVISDIPNVRISRNPEQAEVNNNATQLPSHGSQSSVGSTGRSVPTTSSRGSDSKRLIAPDVVAQLIGNQVGNMVFDNVNKMWQKVKTPRPTVNILPSEDSEDDPFASIPDLTVDSAREKKHLDLAAGNRLAYFEERAQNDSTLTCPASEADQPNKSIHSPLSAKHNCQAHAETTVEEDEEIDQEISLHEDRIQKATPFPRKNLTITFSSPIASIIQDAARRDSDTDSNEEKSNLETTLGSITADSVHGGRHEKLRRSIRNFKVNSASQNRPRGVSRNYSVERQAFIPRPVSRIDEQDENAPGEHYTRQKSQSQISTQAGPESSASESDHVETNELSVVMATPDPARATSIFTTPMIGQYVGTLSLTPLSEFTVHQVDNSCALEVSYVVGDQYLVTGDGTKKTMSKAVRSLVEKITEVEPFEPDWETVPELNLSNKKLDTLHMLDEFCTTLVTLDASNNTISHLDGVPQSVRNLRMTHNLLSELTAWRQLRNLQYVDISSNQIKSLSAFKDLVHLRTLRADDNQITSLDGIKFHDGLQVLRARGNMITHVDFDGTKMQRLTELDLENNQIVAFENCEQLTRLSTLNLQKNCLTSFAPSEGKSISSLRFLKLSNNNIGTLDLSVIPSLRLLHVDRNNITRITGFSQCRHLDSLSLREQKGIDVLDTSFLDSACEVRKLFLSGNRLSSFTPGVDFLNLQYLELANCGLESLAPDIGQLMPNLRMLNINFNAIDDLWPLRYIPRLKKLLAVGNRLSEAGRVANTLAEFPHLSRLDLRNNGATLGFYAPVQTLVSPEDDEKEAGLDSFVLPDVNVERQKKFASRLDMGTKLRKRLYDMVVLNNCVQLKMLDGLPVPKGVMSTKDDVWKVLVESGVIRGEEEQAGGLSTH
ncbi:hypothetical protein F4802DRAFT_555693 [Xylaria palmicola]|nr:hypothetical protein F4802DRAFT_555693 [Xylaria palmicola]